MNNFSILDALYYAYVDLFLVYWRGSRIGTYIPEWTIMHLTYTKVMLDSGKCTE